MENKLSLKEHLAIYQRSWRHLFQLDKTYTSLMIATSVLDGLLPYIAIYMSAKILDELLGSKQLRLLVLYVAVTVGLTFLLAVIKAWLEKVQAYHMRILYQNEAKAFADKDMSMDYAQIESKEIGLLRQRIQMESQTGYNLFYLYATSANLIKSLTSVISSLIVAGPLIASATIPLWMKLLMAAALVLVITVNQYTVNQTQKIEFQWLDDAVGVNQFLNYLSDHFSNYQAGMEARLYDTGNLATYVYQKFNRKCDDDNYRAKKRQLPYQLCSNVLVGPGVQLAAYAVVIYGALRGGISVGAIAKYASAMWMLAWGLQEIMRIMKTTAHNHYYLKRYFSYFDIPSQMYQGKIPVEKRILCDGGDKEYEIEFRDVSFRYPSMDTDALSHISLKFKIGERMAVVGRNGSGKTTFIKLLCRLYDPTEGEILLNGIDIRKYDYEEYLNLFSIVFQDFKLFSASLGQNVGTEIEYDEAEVEKSLRAVGFGDRLTQLPEGLKTCLYKDFDENGIEVSGGEAQKIALARAVYRNTHFIILDEPTAALDPMSEAEIYAKFGEIVQNRTAIYISHRLSSCRFCDDIVVFDEGRLVQRGSHEKLLEAADGQYHALWHAQAQYYR